MKNAKRNKDNGYRSTNVEAVNLVVYPVMVAFIYVVSLLSPMFAGIIAAFFSVYFISQTLKLAIVVFKAGRAVYAAGAVCVLALIAVGKWAIL